MIEVLAAIREPWEVASELSKIWGASHDNISRGRKASRRIHHECSAPANPAPADQAARPTSSIGRRLEVGSVRRRLDGRFGNNGCSRNCEAALEAAVGHVAYVGVRTAEKLGVKNEDVIAIASNAAREDSVWSCRAPDDTIGVHFGSGQTSSDA